MLDYEVELYAQLRAAAEDKLPECAWSTTQQRVPRSFPTIALEMTDCPEDSNHYDRPGHYYKPKFVLHVYVKGDDKLTAKDITKICHSFLSDTLCMVRTFGPSPSYEDGYIDMYSIYDGNIIDDAGTIYKR